MVSEGQVRPGQIWTGLVGSGHVGKGQVRTCQFGTGHVWQVMSNSVKAGQSSRDSQVGIGQVETVGILPRSKGKLILGTRVWSCSVPLVQYVLMHVAFWDIN